MAHCQDVKKIPRPSGLVSWIDANHPEGLPTPPVLGASTMGHSTQRSLSVAVMPPEEGALLSAGDSVDSARQLPDSLSYQSDGSVRDVSSDSPSTVVIFPTQEVCLVDATSILHPFFMHRLDVGPIRLTTYAHAFNYRVAVLPDGVKSATRVGRSQRAAERFLEDGGIPWGHQVAVMFQIVSALALDLDLSVSPDAFGLQAFDVSKHMLPGSSPNELRLLIPDLGIAPTGFHDVVIENLVASPTWRSRYLHPGDVTSLRRRWPKALFRTMRKRLIDMERLRRRSRNRPEWEFRHNRPGFSLCQEQVATALDIHMMNVHLELGQLWRCPVEWCTVWKDSVGDGLSHLHEKHGGSQYVAMKKLGKFFPPWTVSRDLWQTALRPDVSGIAVNVRLFHEAGCRLVHKYRVYMDPFPHPALRGGGGEGGDD